MPPISLTCEWTINSSMRNPRSSKCFQKALHLFSQRDEPTPLLLHFLTASDNTSTSFRGNIHAYNNFLAMAYIKANWVFCGPGSFSFDSRTTVHGCIYHYLGAMVPTKNLQFCFLSVIVHDWDNAARNKIHWAQMPNLNSSCFQQLTAMLYDCNYCIESVLALNGRVSVDVTYEHPNYNLW